MACAPILLGQVAVDLGSVRFQLEGRFPLLSLWQCVTQAGRFAVAGGVDRYWLPANGGVGYALVGVTSVGLGGTLVAGALVSGAAAGGAHRPADRDNGCTRPAWREAAPNVMPFALMTMFYMCYFQGPVAVLEWIEGGTAAGVYNSGFLVISAISLIPTVIYMRLLMPRMCRWAEHERSVFTSVFHVGVPAMALIGTVCMACVLMVAPRLLPLLLGRDMRRRAGADDPGTQRSSSLRADSLQFGFRF